MNLENRRILINYQQLCNFQQKKRKDLLPKVLTEIIKIIVKIEIIFKLIL
jgi:hypothetical protein